MAELALKIGDAGLWQDGDIVDAFNRRRIRHAHAGAICHVKHGRTVLPELYQAKTYQFKFERVSKTEVRRTNLITLDADIVSKKPNAKGEQIDVPLFIARRLKHPRHRIFGSAGQERWYGGQVTATHAILDEVWVEIEARTEHRESNFMLWPFTEAEQKDFLILPTDDFISFIGEEYKTPLLDDDGEVVQNRKHRIDWQADLGLSAGEKADVQDKDKPVDWRGVKAPFDRVTIIKTKTLNAAIN